MSGNVGERPPFRARLAAGRFRWVTAILLAVLATGGMLVRLFWPGPVGMADNGDGVRLMCQSGLSPRETSHGDLYNNWAILDYFRSPEASKNCIAYPSTTRLLMQLWAALSRFFGTAADIDLRVALVAFAVFVGLLVLALCLLFRSPVRQGAAALILVLILGDAAFADYLGSPFTETAGLIGIMGIAVTGVYVSAFRSRPVMTWIALAAFLGFAYLLVNAKTQTITTLVPIVVFLLWHVIRMTVSAVRRRSALAGLAAAAALVIAVTGTAGLGVSALKTYDSNPKEFAVINPTEVIFVGILGPSEDPAADLAEMGLPKSMAAHAGQSWWAGDNAPQADPLFDSVRDKMTYGTVAKFLMAHPERAVGIANTAAKDFFAGRPDYLGNFTKDSGASAAQLDTRFAIPSAVMKPLVGGGLGAFVILSLLLCIGAIVVLRLRGPSGSRWEGIGRIRTGFAAVSLLLGTIAWVQLLTCAYGESIENTKHLVLGILAGMLSVATLIFALMAEREPQPGLRSSSAGGEDEAEDAEPGGGDSAEALHDEGAGEPEQAEAERENAAVGTGGLDA
ncbi:hypothetical protein [Leifsonia shinshuensis]|uniref:glycan biosynthesis hexose transferase WsfD n=1 Tax=Leifsonia shinshuensis TaxID=150026 RepID=UPI00286394A3|nr:hypothetical protein [Leifsonia shinshuensis]MDR6972087.1 hypothetical protein [Leifsonia shinshuensis]